MRSALRRIIEFVRSESAVINLVLEPSKMTLMTNQKRALSGLPGYNNVLRQLGFTFTSGLNFHEHLSGRLTLAKQIGNMALRKCGAMLGKRQGLSVGLFIEIYNKVLLPVILYAHEVWGPLIANKTVREEIDLVGSYFLRRALRARKSTPRALLYVASGVMPLSFLVTQKVVLTHFHRRSVIDCTKPRAIIDKFRTLLEEWGFPEDLCTNTGHEGMEEGNGRASLSLSETKHRLDLFRDYTVVRLVSTLSEPLRRALESSRQRDSVQKVVRSRNNGAFLQLLSGHSILLKAYKYRPGYNATVHDTICRHCGVKDGNAHLMLNCQRPDRSRLRPSFIDGSGTLGQITICVSRCADMADYCEKLYFKELPKTN